MIISKANQAVVISGNATDLFRANLYVNTRGAKTVRDISMMGDITSARGVFKTLNGAKKWAEKQLASA